MINTSVVVEDDQVLRLILEFLDSRKLHNTMRSLEKESTVVNCGYSNDILFLRNLVLDGEWEAILIFAQPFEGIADFDSRQFRYLVLKQKFMEVLYFKSGFGGNSTSYSIEDLIKCLNQLEEDCPNKAEYSKLCFLLTVPNLPEQPEYRDWNPATARLKCFEQILDLLRKVIPIEKKGFNGKCPKTLTPIKDRLLHLIIKGLCFESCVDYCQLRAINGNLSEELHVCAGDNILNGPSQESSGNFLSWLKNLSQDAFVTPFEPVNLEVDLKKVKQTQGLLFHKSFKRDDAEILSRSLSLSGRPATTDIASHLSTLETVKNSGAIFDNRPHSTQPPKGVSHSYNEFHYKGYQEKEPITNAVNNGFHENGSATKLENEGQRMAQTVRPESRLNDVVQERASIQTFPHNYATEPSQDLDEVQALKDQQQQDVLKQLEAYERQKQELERQLLELSLRETVSRQPSEAASELPDKRPVPSDSFKSFRNEHLVNNDDFQRHSDGSLQQAQTVPKQNGEVLVHDRNQEITNPAQSEDADHFPQSHDRFHTQQNVNPHLKNEKHDSSSFSVNHGMTSTPAVKSKHKPEELNLEEANVDNLAHSTIPVTPAEKMFPLTPLANGNGPLSVGHWVHLADGSGVLNTSTPKSTRQGSSTPAPLASPVLSVDGATPRGVPLVDERDKPIPVPKFNDADEKPQPVLAADFEKDKENSVSQNQQLPVKRGPKVNGVRRSLVPQAGAKQKIAATEDNKDVKIPAQGLHGNVGKIKSVTNDNKSPATPRMQAQNQQMGQTQQGTRVNGQPPKSGTTFVVHPSAETKPHTYRAPSNEHYPEEFKQPHKEPNIDTHKGREPGTINMTFRKPSTSTPPNNTTVTVNHGNHIPLQEKQKELLHGSGDITFYTVATLEDVQAIRAIAFHPSGDLFAVGSNSKTLRVCTAEGLNSQQRMESGSQPPQPTILFKSNRHHRGSIYCVAWSAGGDIIATGSNDKSIKMTRFDAETCSIMSPGLELAIHSGTVRDLAFVSRASGTPVLVSGGAGDGNILISDCNTGQTVGQLKGHSGHIMSVYADSDDIIASGSADHTVRLWDLRSQRCIDAIATGDSCVASVCVNSSGNMLASGHEDGSCMIYDITAGRTLQLFKPHTMDCRSVRFSPDNNFLLTGSYDSSIIMMDVRKDLENRTPPYSVVAQHRDKVIQCRWHPSLLAFLSSSADRTVSLWAPDC